VCRGIGQAIRATHRFSIIRKGIEGLQPGATLPWLLARLLTKPFQAEPAAVEYQLKVTVPPTVQVKSGLAMTAMEGIHGASRKEWWGCCSPPVLPGFFPSAATDVISIGPAL
jgi:hypothetical protein